MKAEIQNDIITYLEVARFALADADTFDYIAEELDLSDAELIRLRENLQSYLGLDAEKKAEAALIAAAPDLLAALEAVVESFVTGEHYETQNPYTRPYIKAALSAIAKAKGGVC